LEICAIKLKLKHLILSIYRAPSADFNEFIKRLDATLKYLYNPKSEFFICGYINTDYLNENNLKATKLFTENK
jgi:hypothetical protein